MGKFLIGFILGLSVVAIMTRTIPLKIIGVQEELVKLNHGYYDTKNKNFILKDCTQ